MSAPPPPREATPAAPQSPPPTPFSPPLPRSLPIAMPCWLNSDRRRLGEKYNIQNAANCGTCCMFYLGCGTCLIVQELNEIEYRKKVGTGGGQTVTVVAPQQQMMAQPGYPPQGCALRARTPPSKLRPPHPPLPPKPQPSRPAAGLPSSGLPAAWLPAAAAWLPPVPAVKRVEAHFPRRDRREANRSKGEEKGQTNKGLCVCVCCMLLRFNRKAPPATGRACQTWRAGRAGA